MSRTAGRHVRRRRRAPRLSDPRRASCTAGRSSGSTTRRRRRSRNAVIDRISDFYEHENSNIHRAAHTLAARATDAYEAAREKVRRFLNAPHRQGDRLRPRRDRSHQPGRRRAGAGATCRQGDEIVITWLEHHSNIVPWQMLAAEKGATLRVAPSTMTGRCCSTSTRSSSVPRTRIVSIAHVSNALGTVTPVARDGRDRPSPRRARAGRRRAGRVAHGRGRPVARLRLLRVLRAQGLRADGHWRPLRQVRRPRTRRRRGRAAAT